MTSEITRRDALTLGRIRRRAGRDRAQAQTSAATQGRRCCQPLRCRSRKAQSLRMLRPVRFVQADEDVFRANAKAFADKTGVEVKVDFVGWEDINQQTAVTSNSGAGPDIIIGFSDAPHIYVDKLIELTDVADYLGKRYGGWLRLAETLRQAHTSATPGSACRSAPPAVHWSTANRCCRRSVSTRCRTTMPASSTLCQKLKAAGKPAGFALGNAVGDGNGFASWLLWSHDASLLDEEGNVIINSKETVAALKYLKELYPTFIAGTPSWNDVSNNRAYSAQDISLTANGVSLYFSLKNDPATKAIADDTEHQLRAEGRGQDLADGRADTERHGVQAQPLPQRRKGVPPVHDGEGTVRTLAQRQ